MPDTQTQANRPRTLQEMIRLGEYRTMEPIYQTIRHDVRPILYSANDLDVITIKKEMSSLEMLDRLDKPGIRNASFEEFLAFTAIQRQRFHIYTFGAVWEDASGAWVVPGLVKNKKNGRHLGIGYLEKSWDTSCSFLVAIVK